jgi:cytochrome b561
MTKNGEEIHVAHCLQLIETRLGWGKMEAWTNYDFEKLSDVIHESTGVQLSVTTLKRIWGRLKYENAPTLTTLNALAQFAGYADWRTLKQQSASIVIDVPESAEAKIQNLGTWKKWTKVSNLYWLLLFIPFLGYVIAPEFKPDPEDFEFSANKIVTEGVPNSVVFHYNAEAASTDSVFITQSWDISKKKRVPKNGKEHSSLYYYPGFFKAQLLIDNYPVKTHNLWITSNGWLCLAEGNPQPLYFKKEEYMKDSIVQVNEDLLKAYYISLHPNPPRLRFFNERDLGDIMSDNFSFETTVKNDFNAGANACQRVEVYIQCKNDIIIIPLIAKTCIGDIYLSFCGTGATSQYSDLSKFGADLSQWTKLRVVTVNKRAVIYVNGIEAYSLTFPNKPAGIVGVQYRLNGVGAVKDTKFESKGRLIQMD